MWTMLITPLLELIKEWFTSKREETKAAHKGRMTVLENKQVWENKAMDASALSWKDEWFTLLLSVPILALMYGAIMDKPDVVYRVGLAFEQFNNLPEWYIAMLFLMVLTSTGRKDGDGLTSILKFFKRG